MTQHSGFAQPQNTWDRRFDRPDYLFGTEPNAYLKQHGDLLSPGLTLCLADGEGRNSVWLAQQGHQVHAFDFSAPAIAKGERLAQDRGVAVTFTCCAWADFDWGVARYDHVVGIFFQFAPPQERDALFAHIDACLKPGGRVLIQGYTPKQLEHNTGGPGKLEHLYDEVMMRAYFPHYEWLDLRTYEAHIHEGEGHHGPSGLLGLVAQKPLA
jgi:cyclopropane fatty-acyl-phospholipid synthase-like methyltransferase